jgi:GH24 family phage-related lysozyme (muramidase)
MASTVSTTAGQGGSGSTPAYASEALIDFIKRCEDLASTGYGFYDDPRGFYTVGYGHFVGGQTCSIDTLLADKDSLNRIIQSLTQI